MPNPIVVIADTLSQKPEVGIFSSMVGVALSPLAILSIISAALGLLITLLTLVIKVMDMRERIKRRRRGDDGEDYVMIGDQKYTRKRDADEE